MAVAQLISHFEQLDSTTPSRTPSSPPAPVTPRKQLRLDIETAFGLFSTPPQQCRRRSSNVSRPSFSLCSPCSTISSTSSSPIPASKRFKKPVAVVCEASGSSSPFSLRPLRRQPSSLDVALEAERYATIFERDGLDLLEPRASPAAAVDRRPSAVLMDSIFEIMESW